MTTTTPSTTTTTQATTTQATTSATTGTGTSVRTRATVRTLGVGLGLGALAAVVANSLVFAVANLGAPIHVPSGTGSEVVDLGLADILVASIAWLVIGAVGLWVCEKLFARGFAIWAIGAVVITAASIVPVVALDVDAGSKVALSVAHVVVVVAAVGGQAVARRRSVSRW